MSQVSSPRAARVRRASVATAVLAMGAAAVALAQSATPAERAIEYRQAVFKVVGGNFGPLAQATQGKLTLAPADARKHAERLASIAAFTPDAFPEASREGKTKAKAEIWSNRADFDKRLEELQAATRTLASVAARAEVSSDEFKSAVGAVGNACKGCHDRYREK